tara:strand:+ start:366 stop:623 length:258 start_codon:yes stop_codon:yes gene_type:complete
MIKDDNKLIWDALISESGNPDANTYDAEGREPGLVRSLEDEEGPTSNLDNLIGLAVASEDAEGVEDVNVTDETEAFKEIEDDTPL